MFISMALYCNFGNARAMSIDLTQSYSFISKTNMVDGSSLDYSSSLRTGSMYKASYCMTANTAYVYFYEWRKRRMAFLSPEGA
jgi:hypothetical protein